jgi:hypothetical protein
MPLGWGIRLIDEVCASERRSDKPLGGGVKPPRDAGRGSYVLPLLLVSSVSGALIVLVFESLLPEMFSERDLIKAKVFRASGALEELINGGLEVGGVTISDVDRHHRCCELASTT